MRSRAIILAAALAVMPGCVMAGLVQISDGDDARGDAEFILKQDTAYMIEIISNSAANKTGFLLEWYEHTDKTD